MSTSNFFPKVKAIKAPHTNMMNELSTCQKEATISNLIKLDKLVGKINSFFCDHTNPVSVLGIIFYVQSSNGRWKTR